MKACRIYPAYRDSEGKKLIFDTTGDLIKAGFFPEDSDLTFDQMKEALDTPCMIGVPRVSVKMFKPLPLAEVLSTSSS
jgi:hypothetical protein